MTSEDFIPKGAASFAINYIGPPKDFYFLLLPKMTLLAFSAAVEPLRIANQVAKKELYRWFTMTEDGMPVRCSNRVSLVPDMALRSVLKQAYSFVCSGIEPSMAATDKTINWLRRQRAFGAPVGGICTGTFALAKAGFLNGRKFTLHWENQPAFVEYYPDLEPSTNLYEKDGDLLTCGGGNAATDMMLEIIENDHGKDLAIIVADMCIHSRSHNQTVPQKSAYSVALGCRNQRLISAMHFIEENLEEPLDIATVADHVKISKRQLERLFKKYVSTTPNQYYFERRIPKAHALLNETNMSVSEIAMVTGFSSTTQFTTRFRNQYGVSPQTFRKGWES